MVLKDHAKKGISPIGLKYQPRPHLRPDHVSERSVPELRTGPPQPHDSEQLKKKTVSSDTQTINSLKETLATMIPDQTKRVQGERRIQSAANRSTFRANKPKQPERSRMQTAKTLNS